MLSPTTARHTLKQVLDQKLERSAAEARNCGPDWRGVRHGRLVKSLSAWAKKVGWGLCFHAADLNASGTDMVVSFRIDCKEPDRWSPSTTLVPCVGVNSSNSMRRLLTFYYGYWSTPEGCGYCVASFQRPKAEWMYKKGFRLEDAVSVAVAAGVMVFSDFVKGEVANDLTDDLVPVQNAVALLGEAAENAGSRSYQVGVPWSKIGRAVKTFGSRPNHTSWDLLTAYGQAVALCDPKSQMDQLLYLWDLVRPREISKIPQETP